MKRTDPVYLQHFYSVVVGGIVCGLQHPIEWVANHLRSLGLYPPEKTAEIEEACVLMLCEFFEFDHIRPPENGAEVVQYVNQHYHPKHLCHGMFDEWQPAFDAYIASVRVETTTAVRTTNPEDPA